MKRFKIGCDIGGTFTDLTLFDSVTENIEVYKLLSSPHNFEESVIKGVKEIMLQNEIDPKDVEVICHSTTVGLNTLVERKGRKTALLTTQGFRDVLEIGRGTREHEYDLFQERVEPLVPRNLRFGVKERLNFKGEIVERLDEPSLREVVKKLKEMEVYSIAVSYLHSYVNPIHEERTKEIIKEIIPNAIVSLSSEINPVYREYERTSSTVVNAYIAPSCIEYLNKLEAKLSEIGLDCKVDITQNSGGLLTLDAAKKQPINILMAGPAAGVYAAKYIGKLSGYDNVIALDTGGTTQLISLIEEGNITPIIDAKISGYPIRTPVIDVRAIGAGGGALAKVDSAGKLSVGPQSAGASPGPVCYNVGGEQPTVTDADVVLGYLNPDYFLGGHIKLAKEKARQAILEKIAKPLNLSVDEAASGIIEVINSERISSIRKLLIESGYDPRDFAMVAFGGAGPVHAAELAKELDLKAVIVPNHPGLLSPIGSLSSELRRDYVNTINLSFEDLDKQDLVNKVLNMKEKVSKAFNEEGIPEENLTYQIIADIKYAGQLDDLIIDITDLNNIDINDVKQRFFNEHNRLFGYFEENEKVTLTNIRLVATSSNKPIEFKKYELDTSDSSNHAILSKREVYFKEYKEFVECPIYKRSLLKPNNKIQGPAIVEEYDSTTVIYPDQTVTVDQYLNLIITKSIENDINLDKSFSIAGGA